MYRFKTKEELVNQYGYSVLFNMGSELPFGKEIKKSFYDKTMSNNYSLVYEDDFITKFNLNIYGWKVESYMIINDCDFFKDIKIMLEY